MIRTKVVELIATVCRENKPHKWLMKIILLMIKVVKLN